MPWSIVLETCPSILHQTFYIISAVEEGVADNSEINFHFVYLKKHLCCDPH